MKNKNTEKIEFLKIVYFDEAAAQDYVDVTNGGRLDWSTQENKEKIAKIVAEIEAQAKSGFNILNYIKATFQGKVDASASAELTSAFDKTIKNTLLTDYIQAASKDEHVKKFENRETNVLLFDEFDKALSIFHSAFYQLFDEGIYEDHNYKVVVNKAIIMCTSNYKTIDEIKEHLGLPIYNRFDSIIKFNDLSGMAKEKIAEREIERLREDYDIEDRELFDKIKKGAVTQSNAREIKHLIKDTFSLVALNKVCGETEI